MKGISIGYRFGAWNEEGYVTRSNYREFLNLVETLEEVGRKENVQGKEVFICTDNMMYESISAAGSSKSEVLLYLLVRLHFMSTRFK